MPILYFLQSIRTPFLDTVMSLFTRLGEETVFLVVALLVFWCIDKKRGYLLMLIGFMGIVLNQFLKLTFRIPRPWVKDPGFSIVSGAMEEATGYSFPSGHTQTAAGTFGCVARGTRSTAWRIVCIVLVLLVAFSRMYLGVHTPLDVGVSLLIGAVLVIFVYPLLEKAMGKDRSAWWVIGGLVGVALVYLLYTELYPFPLDMDPHNLESGRSNAYTMIGCALALFPVYALDRYRLHFETKAPLPGQIMKLLLGAAIAVALKTLLKQPLLDLFDGHMIARAVRYFIIVLFAGVLWPMTFPLWQKLGRKKSRQC